MSASIDALVNKEYQYGFVTDVDADTIAPGLSEDVVRLISAKKNEPQWLLDWRLKAYRRWLTMSEPHWPRKIRFSRMAVFRWSCSQPRLGNGQDFSRSAAVLAEPKRHSKSVL